MRPIHPALLLVATFPATGVPQTPSDPARSPVAAPAYRGFTPGLSYREFLERARPLADSDFVRCQTSPHTAQVDRKSTRLNSSHTVISYAVFCLKKKKKNRTKTHITHIEH